MVNLTKDKKKQVQQQQQNLDPENPETESSRFSCGSFCSALPRLFSLGCLIFLVFSFGALLSAIFWLFPRPIHHHSDQIVHLNASVQACFRLHKPASELISHEGKLEMDIFSSIHLSNNTKVAVLSLHQSDASNFTDVKFGVLPVPTNHTMPKDSLTSLRSSFVNLFAKRWSTLNLTTSTFGVPTSFQVLKFPGGITVDPLGLEPVSGLLELLFSLTLDFSLSEIQDKVDLLKNQLELVLDLELFESFRVVLTNHEGSTISPPVTVRGCVVSTMTTMESNIQERFDHLAQPPAKNFGLDNSVFGEVKNVSFTTYLEGTVLDSASVLAPTPTS